MPTGSFGRRDSAGYGSGKGAAAKAAPLPSPLSASVATPRKPASRTFLSRLPWCTLLFGISLYLAFQRQLATATDLIDRHVPGYFSLMGAGASDRAMVLGKGEWWRLFTCQVLHGSPTHLIGNLIALALVGVFLEPLIGSGWFAAIYLTGGLSGAALSMALNPAGMPTVGASGAIMALTAALYAASYHPGIRRPNLIRRIAGLVLFPALEPALTDHGAHVDIYAHLGGALAGMALSVMILAFWIDDEDRPAGGGAMALTALLLLGLTLWSLKLAGLSYERYAAAGRDLIPFAEVPVNNNALTDRSYALVVRYPKDPRAQFLRGVALLEARDAAAAESYLRESIRLSGPNGYDLPAGTEEWARAMLALDLNALGRHQEGLAAAEPVCASKLLDPKGKAALDQAHLC